MLVLVKSSLPTSARKMLQAGKIFLALKNAMIFSKVAYCGSFLGKQFSTSLFNTWKNLPTDIGQKAQN